MVLREVPPLKLLEFSEAVNKHVHKAKPTDTVYMGAERAFN